MESRLRQGILIATLVMPWLVWPGLEHPFSSPKLIFWAGFTAPALLVLAFWRPSTRPALPRALRLGLVFWGVTIAASAAWNGPTSLIALALPLCGMGWFLVVTAVGPRSGELALHLAAASGVIACWSLLQFFRLDPWAVFGLTLDSAYSRMRVFSTLGNPNFVAAFLVAALPLTAALPPARIGGWKSVLMLLEAAALLATGSRAAALGLIASGIVFAAASSRSRWFAFSAAASAVFGVTVLAVSPARPLALTLAGRMYVWRVAAPHVLESPLFGLGPGAVEARYPAWENDWWQKGNGTQADRAFAAAQDHAHNDYLEVALETGFAGLGSLVALVAAVLAAAWKQMRGRDPGLLTGAAAGIAALCAVALVDFPFHRPAELFLFWSLMALAVLQIQTAKPEASQTTELPRRKVRKELSHAQ